MTHPTSPRVIPACGLLLALVAAPAVVAQTAGRPKPKPPLPADVKRLDARLDDLRDGFLREANDLIDDYEKLGLHDRAKLLLEALGRLDPANEAVKRQLAEVNAKALDDQQFEKEIDPDKGWQPVGTVTRGQTLRIKVSGEYRCRPPRFECGPNGPPRTNPAEDMIGELPLGAVIGVVGPAAGGGDAAAKSPQPFLVGAAYEKPADRDGVLYLRVNLPPKSECLGDLKAVVSGVVKPK